MVLERQNSLCSNPAVDVLVAYEKTHRQEAYSLINKLRSDGCRTEAYISSNQYYDFISYADYKKISKIILVDEKGSNDISTKEVQV